MKLTPAQGSSNNKKSLEFVKLNVLLIHHTSKALLVRYDDRKAWLAKSRIDVFPRDVDLGQLCQVTVPVWLAQASGLLTKSEVTARNRRFQKLNHSPG